MRSKSVKIFIVFLSVVFFADDIDVDVMLAPLLTKVFHTAFHAINRDIVENGADHQTYTPSTRTCASTSIVAVDEDDPTTLETYFPVMPSTAITPEISTQSSATHPGFLRVSYLSLHTILI